MKCALAAVGFINENVERNKAIIAATLKKCAGAVKWKVYFKMVGADDSAFREIAADGWKVGANTTVGDNTSAGNLLCDMYIWRNDNLQQIPFDFYATGIWAK